MKVNTMKATISGINYEAEPFTTTCEFELIPPANKNHYGTGYYMTVKINNVSKHLIDIRYEQSTDIEILADRWIKNWFGKNAKQITKEFQNKE